MIIHRSLIIREKWLSEILQGNKPWEMRSSKTKIRGRIGLIKAGSGLIVGECTIEDCFGEIQPDLKYFKYHRVDNVELLKKWKYPWFLSNVIEYDEPIPYEHPKGAVIWVKTNHESTIK